MKTPPKSIRNWITAVLLLTGVSLGCNRALAQNVPTPTPVKLPSLSNLSSTAANKGDGDSNAVTPISQSNAAKDLKVTRKIRLAIGKKHHFSMNAINIKIITTSDHTVYLRGVVDSDSERRRIVKLARPIVGGRAFKNQLLTPKETQVPLKK